MVRSGETATLSTNLIDIAHGGASMGIVRTKADRLRGLADDLYSVAQAYDEPSRSICRADALVARTETIAGEIRAVVRGR